jgi:hypothetical protein
LKLHPCTPFSCSTCCARGKCSHPFIPFCIASVRPSRRNFLQENAPLPQANLAVGEPCLPHLCTGVANRPSCRASRCASHLFPADVAPPPCSQLLAMHPAVEAEGLSLGWETQARVPSCCATKQPSLAALPRHHTPPANPSLSTQPRHAAGVTHGRTCAVASWVPSNPRRVRGCKTRLLCVNLVRALVCALAHHSHLDPNLTGPNQA